METLLDLTARMAREGIRRLLVLSGDEHWCLAQAVELREQLGDDSLWVGALPQQEPCVASGALKTLLGREFLHAFFDARHGFDVAAFAALGGTLRAGSWLVLLAPDFARWPEQVDGDSLRWSDTSEPIATPNFNSLARILRSRCGDRATAYGCRRPRRAGTGMLPMATRRPNRPPFFRHYCHRPRKLPPSPPGAGAVNPRWREC